MEEVVFIHDNEPATTSRNFAKTFNIRHHNFLKRVRSLRRIPNSENFITQSFKLISYFDKNGRKRPEYIMTYDGFIIMSVGVNRSGEFLNEALEYLGQFCQKSKEVEATASNFIDPFDFIVRSAD